MTDAMRCINLCPICALCGDMIDAAMRADVLDAVAAQLLAKGYTADRVALLVDHATHTFAPPCPAVPESP
jgi:hypothetical protein